MSAHMTAEAIIETFPGAVEVMPKHPARFRDDHLDWVHQHVPVGRLLDPFAGVGTIHALREHGYETHGIEIEPAWACASPYTTVGDATDLPFPHDWFDSVVTSPVFGNRMSDHHNAKDASKRNTYTHVLGEPLLPNNAGKMHFHETEYKRLHAKAWHESYRVLKAGGMMVVNAKNFIRKGEEIDVVGWHKRALSTVFGRIVNEDRLESPGMREGRNGELRVDHESMLWVRKTQ